MPAPDQSQKTDSDQDQKTVRAGSGKPVENKGIYSEAKTFFKTLKLSDDDAPVISALKKLNEAARGATGKDLTEKDFQAFDEIIELIIDETTIAQTRTKSVSVYLKFAAENLRRRLYAKPSKSHAKTKSFEPGSPEPRQKEVILEAPEPLGAERELLLANLSRIAKENGLEAIEIFRVNYLPEDWQWILENLQEK